MEKDVDKSTDIFETLKKEILDLTIKPGEKIVETEVCERFSLTRPPVRTAMRRLCDMGIVEIKPYYGTFATLIDMDKVYELVHMRITMETKVLQDFIESKPDPFLIEELEHNIRLQKIMLEEKNEIDRIKFFELDNNLHKVWFSRMNCGQVWSTIQTNQIEYTRFRMLDYKTTMKYPEMIEDHAAIVEQIVKGSSKQIPNLIGQHVSKGLTRITERFLKDHEEYIHEPKNINFWQEYNSRYYGK